VHFNIKDLLNMKSNQVKGKMTYMNGMWLTSRSEKDI